MPRTNLISHVGRATDVVDGLLADDAVGVIHPLAIPCYKCCAIQSDLPHIHICVINADQIARVVRMLDYEGHTLESSSCIRSVYTRLGKVNLQ